VLIRALPNGTATYYSYDDAARLSTLENRKGDGTPICTFEFTRDPNGNITKSLREDSSCWYYEYDGLQRLTKAEWKDDQGASLYGYEYQYDKVGNRSHLLSNGSDTYYTYNPANELTVEETPGVETAYYTYDGRGNQIQRSVLGGHTTYFEYNSRNLITRIDSTDPAFTTPNTFAYNGLGQRVQKVDSTGTTKYLWDGLNIILELDANNAIQRRYTHGHADIEGVASLIDVEDSQGDHYFYHFDQVGGVHNLTDESQSVAQYYDYSPYGRMLKETGSAPNPFGFPGTYLLLPDLKGYPVSPTRPYDSARGRFCSRDPMLPVKRYHYGQSNPLRVIDPAGQEEEAFTYSKGIRGHGKTTFSLYKRPHFEVYRLTRAPRGVRRADVDRRDPKWRALHGNAFQFLLQEARRRLKGSRVQRPAGTTARGVGSIYRTFLFRCQDGIHNEVGHWYFGYVVRSTGRVQPPQESLKAILIKKPTWVEQTRNPLNTVKKQRPVPVVTRQSVPRGGITIVSRGIRFRVTFSANDKASSYYWAQTFLEGVLVERRAQSQFLATGDEIFDAPFGARHKAPRGIRLQGKTALTATPTFEDTPAVQIPIE